MKLESKTGIVIVAHGSKLREANDTIHEVVEMIKKKGWDIVDPAYLQFGRPDLSQSIKNVVQRGCRRVVIVPLFLFMGNHVSIDIPKMIEKEAEKYDGINFVYARNLGADPRIGEIVLDRIKEAIAQWREL